MSLEELRTDLKRNAELASMAAIPVDIRQYMATTMWPFVEAVLDHLGEQDDAIAELIEQAEDFLHADTAKEIGKPLGIGFALADALEKLAGTDPKVKQLVAEYRTSAQTALATLRDVSIADDEDEEEGAEGESEEAEEEDTDE